MLALAGSGLGWGTGPGARDTDRPGGLVSFGGTREGSSLVLDPGWAGVGWRRMGEGGSGEWVGELCVPSDVLSDAVLRVGTASRLCPGR